MSVFTSKATGNWSAGGQTTWNEVGVPGTGDTVTINSPHTVTLDISFAVGNGSDPVLVISSGATLALAANTLLTVIGGIDQAGSIDMGDGAGIQFAEVGLTQTIVHIPPVVVAYPDRMIYT